jgi:hypothetical protein
MSSSWWVNGVQVVGLKTDGYLPLTLRLDALPGVKLNYTGGGGGNGGSKNTDGGDNVIAVWTDNSGSTGWWYEGSGLTRHARLVVAPQAAQLLPFAVASPSEVAAGSVKPGGTLASDGLVGAAAVTPSADIHVAKANTRVTVVFTMSYTVNETVAVVVGQTRVVAKMMVTAGDATITAPPIHLEAQLWSVARPFLYTMVTTLTVAAGRNHSNDEMGWNQESKDGESYDTVNTTVGIRSIEWSAVDGLHLNEQTIKMRGFCNHESFGGVGAAIPPRIDLLRIQQMRGVGGNAWRTSHNPPEPMLLDIADRLGILVLDENRVFATTSNCPGDFNNVNGSCNHGYVPYYTGDVAAEVGKLALRDRNHASVLWYSLCNEAGCGPGSLLGNDTARACQRAIHAVDKSRAITGNMYPMQSANAVAPGSPISQMFDVMGMSHQGATQFDAWHAQEPGKLVVATECCSCETQRGEDADLLPFRSSAAAPFVYASNENSICLKEQTQASNAVEWVGGTFVWTLHDYMGEPGQPTSGAKTFWPHVSSSFGSFDLSGFPKAPAWWYRSWWLAAVDSSDAGRPPLPLKKTSYFCRLVESWQPVPHSLSAAKSNRNRNSKTGTTTRQLHVYTNAPFARILINGGATAGGDTIAVAPFSVASFNRIAFAPGNITAECLLTSSRSSGGGGDGGGVLASHTKHSWGVPAAIKLTLDVPSIATGTGSSVYLDGADVALVRATVVDVAGNVVHGSTANITFTVVNGPARLVGVGNGDPANQNPNHAASSQAYHGLARAIFRATLVAVGSAADRSMVATVNKDAGAGPRSSTVLLGKVGGGEKSNTVGGGGSVLPTTFTVMATATGALGVTAGHLTVPLSVNSIDNPLNVAAASVELADIGEND